MLEFVVFEDATRRVADGCGGLPDEQLLSALKSSAEPVGEAATIPAGTRPKATSVRVTLFLMGHLIGDSPPSRRRGVK